MGMGVFELFNYFFYIDNIVYKNRLTMKDQIDRR